MLVGTITGCAPWATSAHTLLGVVSVAVAGTTSAVAVGLPITPRWGTPSACTLRVPLAAMGLTIVAAAPRTNDDAVGALLQVFGSAAGVVQIFAVAVAVAVAMRLIWVTLRDERRGHGPSCPPVH